MASTPSFPSATAAISWLDGGLAYIRVYSSDGYNITERCGDANGWTSSNFLAQGNNVSATCWMGSGGLSIRVYCTFEDKTTEWCFDQGGAWYVGAYTTN